MRVNAHAARWIAAGMAVCVAGACGGSGGDEPQVALGLDKNRARWALPLDEFHGLNYAISDYAESLLIEECMLEAGFAYPVGEPKRMDSPPEPTLNDAYRRLFDEELAAEYGYGGPPVEPVIASLTPEERAAIESDEGQAAFDRCVNEARDELPLPPERDLVESLASAAYSSAMASEEVVDAAKEWRECMAATGISDLPATPEEMPTESLRAAWGKPPGGEDQAYQPPTPAEIEVAVEDARCQERSGFAQAFYEAEWEAQEKMLADNEDALARLKAANDAHAEMVEEILTSRG